MFKAARHALLKLLSDRAGNVAVISALCLPVVLGAFGIGAEAASWISLQRALQNAADAAAIAAATNGGSSYAAEAKAVAAQYGFQDGASSTTVIASDTAPCPAGVSNSTCYSVTVTRVQPVLLAQMVGFKGDTTLSGSPAKTVSATAVAVQGTTNRPYCLLALGSSGVDPALRTNGAPNADLSGCNVMSNTGATCNGHNLKADIGDAAGTNNGCGVTQHSNVKAASDPYDDLAGNIPPDPCGGNYPQEPAKKKGSSLPATNTPAGAVSWKGVVPICGDLQLINDVTIGQDTTLVIYNGDLDTNGYTLQTAAGVGATVIFAGSNSGYTHIPTGGGTIDIAAPTSGTWSGIAMYQSPNLTSGVDFTEAGNNPTWDVTGIAYFPHAGITFSGAVNKASNGKSCFGLVVDNITINGTADILAHGQCDKAGVTLPSNVVAGRGRLVQ